VLGDLNQGIPVASEAVDAVFANQVIEHVGNPLHFAMEVHRVLRPGGVLVATTPNIQFVEHMWSIFVRGIGPLTSDERKRTPTVWDDGHVHYFTASDLDWIARTAGFRHARTTALIAASGRLQALRELLDRLAGTPLVKRWLSGNAMLVATK
jgi:SAM-dependent methyltransferase